MKYSPVFIPLLFVLACGEPKPPPAPKTGLHFVSVDLEAYPPFQDTGDPQTMFRAIDRQLQWLDKQSPNMIWSFGEETVSHGRMKRSLIRFREIWETAGNSPEELNRQVGASFKVYRVEWDGSPDILITGYHAPVTEGRLQPDARFNIPLYRMPSDAVTIRPSFFDEKMLQKGGTQSDRVIARLDSGTRQVVPYFTREEIDGDGCLSGQGLELVYLSDYFDAFLFHVQGGGFVKLGDGRIMKLNYAGKNSHPYTSIGKALVKEGKISQEAISIQAIKEYFNANPSEVERVCFLNKSYVFYQTDGQYWDRIHADMFPTGVLGFPVSPKRSIATDKRFFPGGALAFIQGTQRKEEGDPLPFSQFVIDQDTGGAIRRGHIDFFQGAGPQAEADAGLLKDEHGRLFFLVLREAQGS